MTKKESHSQTPPSAQNPNNSDIATAQLSWDPKGQPYSTSFDDIYFSKEDGIAESRYVFLQGNQLPHRWNDFFASREVAPSIFTIGETGFGTGLNFLLTWAAWKSFIATHTLKPSQAPHLHYISAEKFPLSRGDLTKALALWPELSSLSRALLAAYPPQPSQGVHKRSFTHDNLTLTMIFDEADSGFKQLLPYDKQGPHLKEVAHALGEKETHIDAWYLDGFAPAKNPSMWSESLFSVMRRLSKANTTFATFTAASLVRKSLTNEKFICEKIKGYGRKREMLTGRFHEAHSVLTTNTKDSEKSVPEHFRQYKKQAIDADEAWHIQKVTNKNKPRTCIVIGGGISGCHTARALANKGFKVTLLERNEALAMEASGNRQGVVYGKMSLSPSPINEFNLRALLFANYFYHTNHFYKDCGDACGVLQLANNHALETQYREFATRFSAESEFVRFVTPDVSTKIAGLPCNSTGLYFENTGWLDPRKLCQHLIAHPNIQHISHFDAEKIEKTEGGWKVTERAQQTANAQAEPVVADILVVASAHDALHFSQLQHLPIKKIRGQVTHIKATPESNKLQCVLCGDGYLPPAIEGAHALGASFNLGDTKLELHQPDHDSNLQKLKALSPAIVDHTFELDEPAGKVGFRCTAPDYLPLVGPVADVDTMKTQFAFLSKKANAVIDAPGEFHDGLYVNIAHGSRGLCYTPICAEVIASLVSGDFLPVEHSLYRYIHPARFILRDLKRNKVSTPSSLN
ncbi:MAG: bifunctional tRNA (5-methylaminomethyl-2-thiouridine)(34)-methyltransferase MnmD/FAD-dependent 5-carboxymethylaminomethyl-2-thiouridine(34) oxidoreductase MnmC [Agarilytica sp.]